MTATTRARSWRPSARSPASSRSARCSVPRLGRTANEIAAEAGLALPAEAAALRDAAQLFDDICYGERPGTPAGYALVHDLDTRLQSAHPAEPSTSDAA